ncbi:uncharacterized protein LOC125234756 [Leguminivora glycinivorella]|uniref:uncharacterized protein LOC125234756 n=1 Tax=Leguminivora glycinivorella TaxID=1035111 RepID=UPI00200D4726|nr:uncharacterized protein LOC125234756 [Leguminivora glycinivorella]
MSLSEAGHTLKYDWLPFNSKQKLVAFETYERFITWKNKRNEQNFNEEVFLAYFTELAMAQTSSNLWAQYSMLKATVRVKHHVLIEYYGKLLSFLKSCSFSFKSQQSEVLTEDNILQFINEAPDEKYLATKVALIIGVGGACQPYELTDLTVDDIKTNGDLMSVHVHSQGTSRTFIVPEHFVPVVKKYQRLRPKNMPTYRFFIGYRNGKCTKQVIGRNTFSALPKQIATYLKLKNPERYTGHCYRRSAITARTTITDRPRQSGPLETLARLDKDHTSTVEAKYNDCEVDVKIEEMDVFEEEPWLNNEFQLPMEYDKDVPTLSKSTDNSGVSNNNVISAESDDNDVQIIEPEIETIDLTTLKEYRQPKIITQGNFTINGNNINISFMKCNNITINFKE